LQPELNESIALDAVDTRDINKLLGISVKIVSDNHDKLCDWLGLFLNYPSCANY